MSDKLDDDGCFKNLATEYRACHALLDEHNIEKMHETGEELSLYGRLHELLDFPDGRQEGAKTTNEKDTLITL